MSTGSAGSGTEVIAFRVLRAAGLDPDRDIRRQALSVNASVDAIKDDKIDAFFWSGGLPTASVLDLASTAGLTAKLIANDEVIPSLQSAWGPSLYRRIVIPKGSYPGQQADIGVVGVDNALVVDAAMDAQLAYDLTRTLFDRKAELAAIHPEARHLEPRGRDRWIAGGVPSGRHPLLPGTRCLESVAPVTTAPEDIRGRIPDTTAARRGRAAWEPCSRPASRSMRCTGSSGSCSRSSTASRS